MRCVALAIAISVTSMAVAAQQHPTDEPSKSESPAAAAFRDRLIECKPGEIAYFPGKSLGDVFGDAWVAAPVATTFERPQVVRRGRMRWPAGLGQDGARVMTATLVDRDGRAVAAYPLCASAPAIADPAVRAALTSRYTPARFDGVPGMGIYLGSQRFNVPDKGDIPPNLRRR